MFLNFFAYGKFGSHGRFAIYWISRNNGPRCIGATLYCPRIIIKYSFLISPLYCNQNAVVQSVVSLMSSVVVKMLTVLLSTISNSQVFLLKKMWVAFASYSHFFSKNISIYAIFNDQSFHDMLTKNIVSFEQLALVNRLSSFSTKTYTVCNHYSG